MHLSNVAEFWGVNLSAVSPPCASKVKALIFDTLGTAQDCFIGEEEFDSLEVARERFSNDLGCNDQLTLASGQTSKKVYIINSAGEIVDEFGLI
jgi:hypothetical protein